MKKLICISLAFLSMVICFAQIDNLNISLKSGISNSAFTRCQAEDSRFLFMTAGLVVAPPLNIGRIDYGLDVSYYHDKSKAYFGYGLGINNKYQSNLEKKTGSFNQALFARFLIFDKKFFMWLEPGVEAEFYYSSISNSAYNEIRIWDFQLHIGPAFGYKFKNGYSIFVNFNWFFGIVPTHTTRCDPRESDRQKLRSLGTYKGLGITKQLKY